MYAYQQVIVSKIKNLSKKYPNANPDIIKEVAMGYTSEKKELQNK